VTVVGAAGDDEFADFLLQVTPGDLVDVNGMLIADGVIEADEIEFEEPEDNDGDEEDDEDEGDDDD
jgi:endonuclease YncB( thermonuclease family)